MIYFDEKQKRILLALNNAIIKMIRTLGVCGLVLALHLNPIGLNGQGSIDLSACIPDNSVMNSIENLVSGAPYDVDGDGKMDLLFGTSVGKIEYYHNDGAGIFTQIDPPNNPFRNIDIGDEITINFGDINNDGLQDLIIRVINGIFSVAIDDGDGDFNDNLLNIYIYACCGSPFTMFDIDQDGDLDIVYGNNGELFFNVLSNNFIPSNSVSFTYVPNASSPLSGQTNDGNTSVVFKDVDGDALEDMIVADSDGISYYKNDGSYIFKDANQVTGPHNPLGLFEPPIDPGTLRIADLDGDGVSTLYHSKGLTVNCFPFSFPEPKPIPTLSQWGLILLALLMTIFSTQFLKTAQQKVKSKMLSL
jgi:hypothetical protein